MAVGLGVVMANRLNHYQVQQNQYVTATNSNPKKVLLHIDSNQPERTQAVLKQAKKLLSEKKNKGEPIQVGIVANHDGIEMFEQNNPSKAEIMALLLQYNNLKLLACQRALDRRAQNGQPVALIDNVVTNKIAVDTIVEKMQKGWGYQKF